ncbi:hypothetical protein IKF33_00900 [Candidatus Saccharibacteria bacterium]|nr:hypothetical protein [Candidatus Saccharibacteria bacterium]
MDPKENNSKWDKLSEFDPISNEPAPVAPMQATVATPAVEPLHTPEPQPQPAPTPPPVDYNKQMKTSKTISIVMCVLAGVFLCVGVGGAILALAANNTINQQDEIIANQDEIISAVANSMGVAEINSVDDLPTLAPTTGYIYISDWGIKIQVPDSIKTVSYILNANYRPSICFNANDAGLQYLPDFANIAKNPGGMGCLTRVAVSEGNADTDGNSFGEQVFTSDDYNYFYTLPRVFSTEPADQGVENSVINVIKNMLTKNVSSYK